MDFGLRWDEKEQEISTAEPDPHSSIARLIPKPGGGCHEQSRQDWMVGRNPSLCPGLTTGELSILLEVEERRLHWRETKWEGLNLILKGAGEDMLPGTMRLMEPYGR